MAIRDLNTTMQRQEISATPETETIIHPLAVVEEGAIIGTGTRVWRFAHIRAGAILGKHCIVGNSAFIDSGVRIGDEVKIQNSGLIYAGVTIEDKVFIGPNVTFTNDLYPRADNPDWKIVPTLVCYGASIGANATVVCGHTIGAHAMIAAGSVVTKDVPPFTLVRGNPARPVGYVCCCGRKLGDITLALDAPIVCECGCVLDLAAERVLLPRK